MDVGCKMREDDVTSLLEGNLLTEGVIHYVFAKATTIAGRRNEVLFLDPTVAHTMYAFHDASSGPVEEMCRRLLLVIPIADYATTTNEGVHWSILLLHRKTLDEPFVAFRLDSLLDGNKSRCASFLEMLRSYMLCKDFMPLSSEAVAFPSQDNDVDCGCFLCLAALHIAEAVRDGGVCDAPIVFPHRWDASQFRQSLLGDVAQKSL